jgi:phage tail sheath protein FI
LRKSRGIRSRQVGLRETSASEPFDGHIAGIYARTDLERGVWKAPASRAVSLQISINQGDQYILHPRGVTCIRNFRSEGRDLRVWGARTMSSEPKYRYITVRRVMIFSEESIDRGTKWVVFEPNNEELWEKVKQVVSVFLMDQWRVGALAGTTAEEAFFIKCDRTTMTQDDIDNGRLICIIGIAPVKPTEFIVFRITQIKR